MKIEKAIMTDAEEITELTMRSKDYWGYGERQMEKWRAELTITASYINENQVVKITEGDRLVGFYAYLPQDSKNIKLNFLFVEPDFIGKGYGSILMNDFLKRVENDNFERVVLDADPNAEKFYKRFGFEVIEKFASSIDGRFLPVMEKYIS